MDNIIKQIIRKRVPAQNFDLEHKMKITLKICD